MYYPLCLLDLSAMIGGAIGENLQVKDYKEEDLPKILKEFFDSLWHLSLGLDEWKVLGDSFSKFGEEHQRKLALHKFCSTKGEKITSS